ncbi:mitochondrial amidoxime reducing component 2-like protein, partial [Tanacetum coccineum]
MATATTIHPVDVYILTPMHKWWKAKKEVGYNHQFDIGCGFVWDRHWVVVNSKGRGCTQRVKPKLALIQVEFPTKAFSLGWVPTKSSHMGGYYFSFDDLSLQKCISHLH